MNGDTPLRDRLEQGWPLHHKIVGIYEVSDK